MTVLFTTDHCYSGCQKTLFDQILNQSEHNKQNDRQNSNANQRDPVRNVIVVSLDCTLATEHGGSVEANTGNSGQFAQRESNLLITGLSSQA